MKIHKFHGCENSFLIIENNGQLLKPAILCQKYSADGLILISNDENVLIYNKDGTEASMCGNGLRCLTNYLFLNKKDNEYNLKTKSGIYLCNVLNTNPFISSITFNDVKLNNNYYKRGFVVDNKVFTFSLVNSGVWHALFIGVDIDDNYGKKIIDNHFFKDKININFIEIISPKIIRLKTFEVGAKRTKSCGSGAVAAFYLLHHYYNFEPEIKVITEGGSLIVLEKDNKIMLIGPSQYVASFEEE